MKNGAVVAIVVVVMLAAIGVALRRSNVQDCKKMGGLYVAGGKYGDSTCVKNGKIVKVY